jgi:hypothetical protein
LLQPKGASGPAGMRFSEGLAAAGVELTGPARFRLTEAHTPRPAFSTLGDVSVCFGS